MTELVLDCAPSSPTATSRSARSLTPHGSCGGAFTYYDARYVALAAALDVPLLTADARLARAP